MLHNNKYTALFVSCIARYLCTLKCRDFLYFSPHSSLSPTTALTHVKSRALLSIETDGSMSRYDPPHSQDLPDSHALVPMSAEVSSRLEERLRRWRAQIGEGLEQKLPAQQHVCSCPNQTRKANATNIRL